MNQTYKELYLAQAEVKLKLIQQIIAQVKQQTISKIAKIKKEFTELNNDDKIVQLKLYEINNKKRDELELIVDSPYFSRCEVDFGKTNNDIIYIGKFSLSEQQIYSWISPIAKIRFAQPGSINYLRPDKTKRDGLLKQKDQYLITNGQIKYLSRGQIG